jgi:hypothetical protein
LAFDWGTNRPDRNIAAGRIAAKIAKLPEMAR